MQEVLAGEQAPLEGDVHYRIAAIRREWVKDLAHDDALRLQSDYYALHAFEKPWICLEDSEKRWLQALYPRYVLPTQRSA